jgi:signal transduction histidine kinase
VDVGIRRFPRLADPPSAGMAGVQAPARLRPAARSRQLVTAAAVAPLVASSVWLALASDHLRRPELTAVYYAYLIAATMLIGLVWWRRRPRSRFGTLLILFGLSTWVLSWQGANAPLVYTLSFLGEAAFAFLTFYLILAFPMGRLERGADRLLAGLYALVLVLFIAGRSLLPEVGSLSQLGGCDPCPANALLVASDAQLAAKVLDVASYLGLAATLGVVAAYAWRLRTASRPRRRALVAVALTSLLFLPASFVFQFSRMFLGLDAATLDDIGWALIGARVLFPLGFLVALLQADLFAGAALRRLLAELATRPTPERWRDALAGALDDPSLRLAFWEPASGRFLEAGGAELSPPAPGTGNLWVPVERDGQPVAAMAADEALSTDPELLAAAASATLLAVEHGHLETALQASMSRLVEAGDAERRRIQRDLHDSAQQRLVALRIHLGLAADTLGDRPETAVVQQLGDEVDAALDELRNVAHGLYPPLLAKRGVPDALRAAARSSPVPVRVADDGFGRQSAAVENTIYFCCLEALQNAGKHAGQEATVDIRLASTDGELRFTMADDGAGFDPATVVDGAGLSNIADRVAAAGGTVRIDSAPGLGTRVEARLPA